MVKKKKTTAPVQQSGQSKIVVMTIAVFAKRTGVVVDDITRPVISFCEDFGLQDSVVVNDTCLNLESTGTLSFSRVVEGGVYFFPRGTIRF